MNHAVAAGLLLFVTGADSPAAPGRDEPVVTEYASPTGSFSGCTHILFQGRREIVTAGSRLLFRDGPAKGFRPSSVAEFDDPHAVAFNPRDGLFYATDTGRHRLVTFRRPEDDHIEKTVTELAGEKLDRPHDVVVDSDGWVYVLNPNRPTVFRFRGFGQEESSLDLSPHLGYSRALTVVGRKLYVVGSSAGKVIEIDDFGKKQFRVHASFGKRRDAPAGSWQTTGLVPNDVEFHDGYWYVTSYFCPTYAKETDCNQNKFIRFRSWKDFESGTWEDLRALLPRDVVPYYMTVRENALFLATFSHEARGQPGKVLRIESPGRNEPAP